MLHDASFSILPAVGGCCCRANRVDLGVAITNVCVATALLGVPLDLMVDPQSIIKLREVAAVR